MPTCSETSSFSHALFEVSHETHLLRDVFILLKLVGHDDEVGAALLALRNKHAGLDAELARLIVGGGDLPRALSAVGVGHSQGLAPKRGVGQACY